jgi:hypothetical protein
MNLTNLIIKSEYLFGDPNRSKFEILKTDFNPTEIGFLIENINRRSDLNLDKDSLNLASITGLIDFLKELEKELTPIGQVLALIIRVKLINP